jgi:ferritin-like metal-binding protein YciE
MEQLQELLTEELRDLYDAEKQLVRALPKVAKAVTDAELKQGILEHLEVTKNQVTRLEQVFELLGERAKSKPCKAMKGLVEEANEHISEHEKGSVLDSVLIIGSQKIEHYEIAGYGSVRAIAKSLGNREVLGLLQTTLAEEEQTDKRLTSVALRIQKEMMSAKPETIEEEESATTSSRGRSRNNRSMGARPTAKGA